MKTVLLPGLDGTGRLFDPVVPELQGTPVVVVELPAELPIGYAGLVEFVASRLPVGEPFALVAESFSGPIGLELAGRQPPGLVALVLVGTFSRPPLRAARWLLPLVGAYLFCIPPPQLILRMLMLGFSAPASLVSMVQDVIRDVQPAVLAARVRAVLSVDADRAATACMVPVLYLRASADRLVSARSSQHLASLIPQLRIERVEGPHLLLQARPASCARLILEFLAAIEDRL